MSWAFVGNIISCISFELPTFIATASPLARGDGLIAALRPQNVDLVTGRGIVATPSPQDVTGLPDAVATFRRPMQAESPAQTP